MKNTVIEMKNILEEVNSQLEEAVDQIGDLKYNTQAEQRKEIRPKPVWLSCCSVTSYTKGCGFNSWSGHVSSCEFHPWSGCIWEATHQCSHINFPLSLSL